MSAYFIILYCGAPIRLSDFQLVEERQADTFTCEADAWLAAQRAGLNIAHVQIKCIS